MAHEPYVYSYFGEKGLLIPASTSILIPFGHKVRDWNTIYCVAALAVEHNSPNLNERTSTIEYSNSGGYPDMQILNLGYKGITFEKDGIKYNNKFAIGLKDRSSNRDVGDYTSTQMNFLGLTNPDTRDCVSQLYYFEKLRTIYFNGWNDYISYGNILNKDLTGSFFIEAKIKTNHDSARMPIVTKHNGVSPYDGYEFSVYSGKLRFSIDLDSSIRVESNQLYSDGELHTVRVEYDGSTTASGVSMYVDGNAIPTTILSFSGSGDLNNTNELCIGSRYNEKRMYFNGMIYDVNFNNELVVSGYGNTIEGNTIADWTDENNSISPILINNCDQTVPINDGAPDRTINLNLLNDSTTGVAPTGIALGYEYGSQYGYEKEYEIISFDGTNNKFLNFGDPNIMVDQYNEHLLFLGMKFQMINYESSSQKVQISIQELTGQTNTSKPLLESFVNNFSPNFVSQNFYYTRHGFQPIPIPKNFYIKWPFTRSRLRLHAFYLKSIYDID